MKSGFAFILAAVLITTQFVSGQARTDRQPNPSVRHLMGDDGPFNHRLLLATSKDGLNWTVGTQVLAEHASVPELFEGPDGKLIMLFVDASGEARPGALGALICQDDGSWLRRETNLRGADPNVVRLKDGSYRGYTKDRDGTIVVFSSPDGLQWDKLGNAFQDQNYRNTTDSDVFETPDGWVMLISLGPRLLRAKSSEGLIFEPDKVMELGGSVSDTVKVKGGWRTYFHVNASPQTGGKMCIRSAFTADGKDWTVEPGDRVVAPNEGPARLGVADPAPVQLRDGTWLMAVKSFITGNNRARVADNPGNNLGGDAREFGQPMRGPQAGPGGSDGGIQSHQVHSASSRDGLNWTHDEGVRLPGVSVPCAINDGDKRVLLYFVQPPNQPGKPENVACAISLDGTNFQMATGFQIEGLSTAKAVDPSILKDEAGKFRLYYLASNHRGDPASGPNPHSINMALSDDGIHYRETGSVFEYDNLVDPDVFKYKNQWYMYVFGKGGTIIATSADGKKFTFAQVMSPPNWGTTAPIQLRDGRLRLYAFEQRVPMGNAVRSFLSTDGMHWTAEAGDRLKANADEQITDPFVISWRGGYKMYFKSSPARMRNQAGNASRNVAGQNNPRRNEPRDGFGQNPPVVPNNFNPQPTPRNLNADGPWNRDVIAYRVGANGAVEKAATFERAGVPTIGRMKDGRLVVAHQHFPENDWESFDKVAVRFSNDDGKTWLAPQVIKVADLPEGMRFPFDPTLVPLPDGRIRLYFTGNYGRSFGQSTPAIHSAISTDGINYTYEPGVRFAIKGRMVIDCAVVLHAGVFHLYVPDNGTQMQPGQQPANQPAVERPRQGVGYHATSKDGLNFTRMDDVQIEGRRSWLGNAQSDGKRITFYGTGEGLNQGTEGRRQPGFWMATSADGQSWQQVPNPPIGGGDPGAVKTRDGGLLVVITGESRLRGFTPRNPEMRRENAPRTNN